MAKSKRLLIIGHGRHGKDTAAEILRDDFGVSFMSSSLYATEKAVWPLVQATGVWESPEALYGDRAAHRDLFFHAIKAYNLIPDRFLAEEMFNAGFDCYVGMRSRAEFEKSKHLFSQVIWVDRSKVLPPEPASSMELTADDADVVIDNNGQLHNLIDNVWDYGLANGLKFV